MWTAKVKAQDSSDVQASALPIIDADFFALPHLLLANDGEADRLRREVAGLGERLLDSDRAVAALEREVATEDARRRRERILHAMILTACAPACMLLWRGEGLAGGRRRGGGGGRSSGLGRIAGGSHVRRKSSSQQPRAPVRPYARFVLLRRLLPRLLARLLPQVGQPTPPGEAQRTFESVVVDRRHAEGRMFVRWRQQLTLHLAPEVGIRRVPVAPRLRLALCAGHVSICAPVM